MDSNTIIIGDFNISLSTMDRSSRQIINKEKSALNYTLDQINLTDIYRTFDPTAREYIFCSSPHQILSRIGHILEHKTSLNKFKNIESISSIFLTTIIGNQK